MTNRFYIVDDRPPTHKHEVFLTDGGAVLCSVQNKFAAQAVTADEQRLSFRRHADLSPKDQRKVLQVM